jgi:hypothetical protein
MAFRLGLTFPLTQVKVIPTKLCLDGFPQSPQVHIPQEASMTVSTRIYTQMYQVIFAMLCQHHRWCNCCGSDGGGQLWDGGGGDV